MSSILSDKMFFNANQNTEELLNSGAGRVLVVDDDRTTIVVVNRMLETLGFWGHAVNSGVAARECISQSTYDLLVTDLQMPEVDGYALSGFVKKTSPSTKVIIMTGLGSTDVAGYMNTGVVDGWLFKPFSMTDLSRVIRKCELIETPNLSSFSRGNGFLGDGLGRLHSKRDRTDQ